MSLQRSNSIGIYNICSYKPTVITSPDYYHITLNETNSFIAALVILLEDMTIKTFLDIYTEQSLLCCTVYQQLNTQVLFSSSIRALPHSCALYVSGGSYTHVICVLANAYSFSFLCLLLSRVTASYAFNISMYMKCLYLAPCSHIFSWFVMLVLRGPMILSLGCSSKPYTQQWHQPQREKVMKHPPLPISS